MYGLKKIQNIMLNREMSIQYVNDSFGMNDIAETTRIPITIKKLCKHKTIKVFFPIYDK